MPKPLSVGVDHLWPRSVQNDPSVYPVYPVLVVTSPANTRAPFLLSPIMPNMAVTAYTFTRIFGQRANQTAVRRGSRLVYFAPPGKRQRR